MKRTTIGVALLIAALATAVTLHGQTQQSKPGGAVSEPRVALLVIDIQNFYFDKAAMPLVGALEASQKARKLIDSFRAQKWPVIFIQHLPDAIKKADLEIADPRYRIHPNVAPLPAETVIGKHYLNAFRDTPLLQTLRDLGVKKIVIVGMQTHLCVEAAVRAGADLGFDVTVIHDACATRDLKFGTTDVPAAQVQTTVSAVLNKNYARVMSLAEWEAMPN